MRKPFLLASKFTLLLVVMGFFSPVGCSKTGPELAESFLQAGDNSKAILVWMVLICAAVSIIITICFLGIGNSQKKSSGKEPLILDYLLLAGSITCGVMVFVEANFNFNLLQYGAYMIMTGWGASLVLLFIASILPSR